MTHPLIARLTDDLGWPALDSAAAITSWAARPGAHVLFIPGDPARNLESADVAVILPELATAFQGRFDCAVAADQSAAKEISGVHKTPSLVFFRDGACLGGIAKVRDWDDYIARTTRFLDTPAAA